MIPERLVVTTLMDGKTIPNQFISLSLGMKEKNDYILLFGPSEVNGRLSISGEQIISEASEERKLFLMDYMDLSTMFNGSITAAVMNRGAIARAMEAWKIFRDVGRYPVGYHDSLEKAQNVLERKGPGLLQVKVEEVLGKVNINTPLIPA